MATNHDTTTSEYTSDRKNISSFPTKKPKGYRNLWGVENSFEANCKYIHRISRSRVRTDFPDEYIVIRDERDCLFYGFENYAHFNHFYPQGIDHCVHEVVSGDRIQRPKYDIDGYINADCLELIADVIHSYFFLILGLYDVNVLVIDGSGPDKNSAHIVITNYAFANNEEAHAVSADIYNNHMPDEMMPAFDRCVNKSTQNFRTPWSTKKGRTLVTPDRAQGMITGTVGLPIIDVHPSIIEVAAKKPPKIDTDVPDDELKEILTTAAEYLPGWTIAKQSLPFIYFKRSYPVPIFCESCGRTHDRDNFAVVMIRKGDVLLGCCKNKNYDLWKTILKRTKPTSDANIRKILRAPSIPRWAPVFGSQEIYSAPLLLPLSPHRTTFVISGTGTGKTQALKAYLNLPENEYKTVVTVSMRIAFTKDWVSKMDSFESYQAVPRGQIALADHPRLVIQADSIWRLGKQCPDILVLDESESIIEQFSAKTFAQHNRCASVFQRLLKKADECFVMDACMKERTVNIVERYRGTTDSHLIYNKYKNMSASKFLLTGNKEEQDKLLVDKIKAGAKVIISTDTKETADFLRVLLAQHTSPSNILTLTSDTPVDQKKEIFEDVNAQWSKYQVVIYTPVCTAGISFTRAHFDYHFGYYTGNSSNVWSWIQQDARAREIISKEHYICITAKPKGRVLDRWLLEKYAEKSHLANNADPKLQFATDVNTGKIALVKDIGFYMWLENEHAESISKKTALFEYINHYREAGAQVSVTEFAASKIEINPRIIGKVLADAKYETILDAPDIDQGEFSEIIQAGDPVSTENKRKIDRFMLRAFYGWRGVITREWCQTYMSRATREIWTGLREYIRGDNAEKSLELLRQACATGESVPKTTYLRHMMAHRLLKLCGFDDLRDTKIVTGEDIEIEFELKREEVKTLQKDYLMCFGNKKPISSWKRQGILRFINGILTVMYGCSIIPRSRNKSDRDKFSIVHNFLGDVFPLRPCDDKPCIIYEYYKAPPDPARVDDIDIL
jgi:hypothetical protein